MREEPFQDRVLEYRREFLMPTPENGRRGLKWLFEELVDRHYYFSFRSEWDTDNGELKRELWIHLPQCYRPDWPSLPETQSFSSLTEELATRHEFAFPFSKAEFVHNVVKELSETQITRGEFKAKFKKSVQEYGQRLNGLFGPSGVRPAGYPENLYDFEREHFFKDLRPHKRWFFFPLCFRGVWVSMLAARVRADDAEEADRNLEGLANLLPLVSGTIAEKNLVVHAKKEWAQPFRELRSYGDAIALISLVAAQCGMKEWALDEGRHIFWTGGAPLLNPYWKPFDFGSREEEIGFDPALWDYFARVWKELKPFLQSFAARSKASMQLARAAIMSRNLSHNVGSHALANPKLHSAIGIDGLERRLLANKNCAVCKDHAMKNPIERVKTRLTTFHQYTQTRLDFIARTLNPQIERAEPMFFVNDVLNGLFRQTVLLDTLLADRGFPLKDTHGNIVGRPISFHLSIELEKHKFQCVYKRAANDRQEGSGIDVFERDPVKSKHWGRVARSAAWIETTSDGPVAEDMLVGVPGGIIGCHAVYSFLENLMRNAAKYGTHCDDTSRGLEVHLHLREAAPDDCANHPSFFVLEAWENLNDDGKGYKSVGEIRRHIREELIEVGGQPVSKGQGIHEMKIAAEFLAGKASFYVDNSRADGANRCEYRHYASGTDIKIRSQQALRCFGGTKRFSRDNGGTPDSQRSVIYQLLISKARLVGIVKADLSPKHDRLPVKDSQSVFMHKDLNSLAVTGAAFGLILDSGGNDDEIRKVANEIVRLHHALPYRLIVLAPSEKRVAMWTERDRTIVKMLHGYDSAPYNPKTDLPVRRIHFLANPQLYDACVNGIDAAPGRALDFLGATGWEALTLRIYHLWLEAFKGIPEGGTWKILIGFEREDGQVKKRWEAGRLSFSADEQKNISEMQIRFEVREAGNRNGRSTNGLKDLKDPRKRGSFLVFDNHSKAVEAIIETQIHRESLDISPAIYHDFRGSRELSLSQALESPPQSPFSFAYWLYSLVEGSLLNVAIIDERVAEASLENISALQKLRVVPLFKISKNQEYKWVSSLLDKRGDVELGGHIEMSNTANPCITWKYEVRDGKRAMTVNSIVAGARTRETRQPIQTLDAIVLHEGVIDTLPECIWKPGEHDEMRLLSLAPRVIRCSGRGSLARRLAKELPFVEFSEVSDTLYRSRNKPALGRALCSVAGIMEESSPAKE